MELVYLIFIWPMILTTAYANSSWHWISSTRPVDILPVVIVTTLLIESVIVIKLSKVKKSD